MKRNFSFGYLCILTCWLLSLAVYGQSGSGHFVYDLISYEIADSSRMHPSEVESNLSFLRADFQAEIYFNKTWVVALQKKQESIIKRMYHRKSKVLYTYADGKDFKRLRIDSIQGIKEKDKDLQSAIDTLKSYLQVTAYPKEKRRIQGYPCYKVKTGGLGNPPLFDEIWLARFKDVPDLIFPDHLYFLIEGIPLAIIQDFEDVKFKWGVVEMLPVSPEDAIFNQDATGYEVSFMDTPKLIYEGIHFVRTFEPKGE